MVYSSNVGIKLTLKQASLWALFSVTYLFYTVGVFKYSKINITERLEMVVGIFKFVNLYTESS